MGLTIAYHHLLAEAAKDFLDSVAGQCLPQDKLYMNFRIP